MLSEFAKVFERKVWRVQGAHLHNAARALSSLSRCFQLSTNLLSLSLILSFSVALVEFHWLGINWHIFLPIRMQKLLLIYYYSENHATSRIWKVLPNMVFLPIWGKNGGVLSMRMQVILDSLFTRPGSAPIWGGKKGESRDWTTAWTEWMIPYFKTRHITPRVQEWEHVADISIFRSTFSVFTTRQGDHELKLDYF